MTTTTNMPDRRIAELVMRCVESLCTKDAFLFKAGVSERAITHRLANYIQGSVPEFSVDAEYNRHGVRVKTARLPSGVKLVAPDIVIHSRGDDGTNELVVEVKILGRGNEEDRVHAHQKLDAMVFGEEYKYRLGLFLELGFNDGEVAFVEDCLWYVRD